MPTYTFDEHGNMLQESSGTSSQSSLPSANTQELAVVTSFKGLCDMTALIETNRIVRPPLTLPIETRYFVTQAQQLAYRSNFRASQTDNPAEFLEGFIEACEKIGLSLGLAPELYELRRFGLRYTLDDSNSMIQLSDVPMDDPTRHPLLRPYPVQHHEYPVMMLRIDELQNRLRLMLDFLAYIPTKSISFVFINHLESKFTLSAEERRQLTPEQFKAKGHAGLDLLFEELNLKDKLTPLGAALKDAFKANDEEEKTIHYVMTDGEPNDCTTDELIELILTRGLGYRGKLWNKDSIPVDVQIKSEKHPVSICSCTNETSEIAYLNMLDVQGHRISAVDDLVQETNEVKASHGKLFPYSMGTWLVSQLIGAINQNIDDLDEKRPITKNFLSKILGRDVLQHEYDAYLAQHPSRMLSQRNQYEFFGNQANSGGYQNGTTSPYSNQNHQNAGPKQCLVS